MLKDCIVLLTFREQIISITLVMKL